MKKWATLALCVMILAGCSGQPDELEVGLELRSNLLQASECTFDTIITADYGNKIQTFTMNCHGNSSGDIAFTVIEPHPISGISGKLTRDGGSFTFDDTALHYELMADDQLSPISAPWILINTLRNGYMTSACRDDGKIMLSIDDSFEEDALRLDIWLNSDNLPEKADILFDGRRILAISVDHFEIL